MATMVKIKRDGVLVDVPLHEARKYGRTDPLPPAVANEPAASQPRGSAAIWREWHERAAKPVVDHDAEQLYIAKLASRTGCGVCTDHWRALLKVYAVDTSTPATYTAATWFLHNLVSTSIGKPWVRWEQAAEQYRWATPSD